MIEAWESLAWILWRHRGLSYGQVSAHLAAEGWAVPLWRVEQVLMARACAELRTKWAAAGGRKLRGE